VKSVRLWQRTPDAINQYGGPTCQEPP